MKNLQNLSIAVVIIALALVSCGKGENILNSTIGETYSFDAFFEKVANQKSEINQEQALYVTYKWNKTENTITIEQLEQKEPDFFVLENRNKTKQYTVTCSTVWSKTCDGKVSCGTLIAGCLDEGGCASICSKTMVYVPEVNTFYLMD